MTIQREPLRETRKITNIVQTIVSEKSSSSEVVRILLYPKAGMAGFDTDPFKTNNVCIDLTRFGSIMIYGGDVSNASPRSIMGTAAKEMFIVGLLEFLSSLTTDDIHDAAYVEGGAYVVNLTDGRVVVHVPAGKEDNRDLPSSKIILHPMHPHAHLKRHREMTMFENENMHKLLCRPIPSGDVPVDKYPDGGHPGPYPHRCPISRVICEDFVKEFEKQFGEVDLIKIHTREYLAELESKLDIFLSKMLDRKEHMLRDDIRYIYFKVGMLSMFLGRPYL